MRTFESKVERLCREVADNIDNITTPEGEEPLLSLNTGETVNNTFIALVNWDTLVGILMKVQLYLCWLF